MLNNQLLNSLLTPTEAARLKGMKLNRFKYHIGKPAAPKPHLVGEYGHPFFLRDDIIRWQPTERSKK